MKKIAVSVVLASAIALASKHEEETLLAKKQRKPPMDNEAANIERAREIAYAAHATRIDPAERQDAREVYCRGYRDDEPIVQAALSALSTQQDRVKALEGAIRQADLALTYPVERGHGCTARRILRIALAGETQ